MSSRYLPYATTPARLTAQLFSDIAVAIWITLWVLVGAAVHSAISTIGEFGRDLESGANGVADNLGGASERTHNIPLLGDALSDPLSAAGDAARGIAGAGHNLDTTTCWMSWLFLRLRFFRRKWTAVTLASTAAGEQLLALRALANRPLAKLAAINADPLGAWRREDPLAIRGLAALELRAAGISAR